MARVAKKKKQEKDITDHLKSLISTGQINEFMEELYSYIKAGRSFNMATLEEFERMAVEQKEAKEGEPTEEIALLKIKKKSVLSELVFKRAGMMPMTREFVKGLEEGLDLAERCELAVAYLEKNENTAAKKLNFNEWVMA